MVSRESNALIYDLPRVEETWSVVEWRRILRNNGLSFASQTLATMGLSTSFDNRRKVGVMIAENLDSFSDSPDEMSRDNALFLTRIWTMPDRVLKTVSAINGDLRGLSPN